MIEWLNEWWTEIPNFERIFWFLAIPSSVVSLLQLILEFVGMGSDSMDADMDDGFSLAGQVVEQPDNMQRVHFVAMQLFQSFMRENERLRAASCAWLCQRAPELREVKVEDSEEEVSLELIMDK